MCKTKEVREQKPNLLLWNSHKAFLLLKFIVLKIIEKRFILEKISRIAKEKSDKFNSKYKDFEIAQNNDIL